MEIREIELPGVGWKYAIQTSGDRRLTVIIHHTGHRELYFFDEGAEFPSRAIRLDDTDARQLGAILSGARYQPVGEAKLETVLGQLTIDWYEVTPTLADRTIGELEVRRRTGASIIAVLREGRPPDPNPGPEIRLQKGETLMVIGSREQVEAFRRFAGS